MKLTQTHYFCVRNPVDILILQQCWSDITLDIAMILLTYCNETQNDVNLQYQPDIRILRLDESDFNPIQDGLFRAVHG